jgi:rhodanese-related sulfurtransferase
MEALTPNELKKRIQAGEKLNIIDVREDEEVAQGMIPGAKHIPLGQLPLRYTELKAESETILVCRSGNRSGKAYEFLQEMGLTGLKNMTGGMMKWDEQD